MSQPNQNQSVNDPTTGESKKPTSFDAVSAPTNATPSPVTAVERIKAIDVLRGFALLGILPPNLPSFALSGARTINPEITGALVGWDKFAWIFTQVFFQQKMITVFSLLFGAGLILMSDRAMQRGQSIMRIYYRRLMWLFLFGMLHAYFVWQGDILVSYSICGLLLYPVRRLGMKWLIAAAIVFYLFFPLLHLGGGYLLEFVQDSAIAVAESGDDATEFQKAMADAWPPIEAELAPKPEKMAAEIATVQAGYWSHFKFRAGRVLLAHIGMAFSFGWSILALMLGGICLMRSGFLRGERSPRFYLGTAVLGYLIGYPLVIFGVYDQFAYDFDLIRSMKFGAHFNVFGSIPVALGNVGLIFYLTKSGIFPFLTNRLAAVGRMALTNYLSHSVICATIFYGWGFRYFEQLQRGQLLFVVVGIWIFQLTVSPIWLKYFRFGPMEWLWRTLTYWKWQPMRRTLSS